MDHNRLHNLEIKISLWIVEFRISFIITFFRLYNLKVEKHSDYLIIKNEF